MESISCSYDVLIAQSLKKLDDICFIRDWQFSNDKYVRAHSFYFIHISILNLCVGFDWSARFRDHRFAWPTFSG